MRFFNVGKLLGFAANGAGPSAQTAQPSDHSAATSDVARAAMASPVFESILSFWYARQGENGAAPNWSAFQPADHPRLLPHIVLFEASEGRYFARVVGESVICHLPVKLANQFLDEIVPKHLSDLETQVVRAYREGRPTYTERREAWPLDQDCIGYKALTLPFQNQSGAIDRVLSVMLFRVEPVVA